MAPSLIHSKKIAKSFSTFTIKMIDIRIILLVSTGKGLAVKERNSKV